LTGEEAAGAAATVREDGLCCFTGGEARDAGRAAGRLYEGEDGDSTCCEAEMVD
jgi:hypothetical protein